MNTRPPHRPPPLTSHMFAAATLTALLALTGCERHADGDHAAEPSHATPTPGADAHAGHDHTDEAPGHDAHAGHDHGTAAGHSDEVTLTSDAIARYGVRIGTATTSSLRPTVIAPARIGFNTESMAHVGSPLNGRAIEVIARLGDTVTRGQTLIIVESPELGEAQADYLLKRAAVETAGSAIDLSRISWERARDLHEQSQGISLSEVQRREAEHRGAVATVRAAEAAAQAARSRLRLLGMSPLEIDTLESTGQIDPRHSINAAIGGRIVAREITHGELVSPDRDSLMVIADATTLWVLVDVPESKLHGVTLLAKARITIGSTSIVTRTNDDARRAYEGVVSYIAPFVDPTTRTARVRIDLAVAAEDRTALKPGMFAQAEIELATSEDAEATVAVPDEAIQIVEGGPAVFVPVPGEPNTFAKRAVTIGRTIGGLTPVHTGLSAGEPFVAAGSFILKAELGKGSAAHEH